MAAARTASAAPASGLAGRPWFPTARGKIYFTGDNTVRRYDVASGKVDTLAGIEGDNGSDDGTKTAARFYWPQGIALDGAAATSTSATRRTTPSARW